MRKHIEQIPGIVLGSQLVSTGEEEELLSDHSLRPLPRTDVYQIVTASARSGLTNVLVVILRCASCIAAPLALFNERRRHVRLKGGLLGTPCKSALTDSGLGLLFLLVCIILPSASIELQEKERGWHGD